MLTFNHNFPELQDTLKRKVKAVAPSSLRKIGIAAGKVTGVKIEPIFREYPAPPTHKLEKRYTRKLKDGRTIRSPFKSLKQQRFVMKLLKERGRYRRTGELGRRINTVVRADDSGAAVHIELRGVGYSIYVIGIKQIDFHKKTGWKKVTTELGNRGQRVAQIYAASYIELLDHAINKK